MRPGPTSTGLSEYASARFSAGMNWCRGTIFMASRIPGLTMPRPAIWFVTMLARAASNAASGFRFQARLGGLASRAFWASNDMRGPGGTDLSPEGCGKGNVSNEGCTAWAGCGNCLIPVVMWDCRGTRFVPNEPSALERPSEYDVP